MEDHAPFSEEVKTCVTRMAESGVAALAGLFDLTSQRLVRYAATVTRNQHDAEDAVQAALVQVARQQSRLCRADHPWPYLLRMVRNEALVIVRRKRRWSLIVNLSDLLTRRSVDEVELEDSYRAVWSALRSLPTNQAEVVVLKIWEEMTFAQIAEILEVSAHTTASRYRYAMQKLSQKLAPTGSYEGHAEVFHD
jgi:RNA polymerase sigma-70 factor (ECF subfamily)